MKHTAAGMESKRLFKRIAIDWTKLLKKFQCIFCPKLFLMKNEVYRPKKKQVIYHVLLGLVGLCHGAKRTEGWTERD